MDTLCRVCIEKVAKGTSLSSKIEESSNLSFFDFLNKCTTLNASESDSLPQGLCSVCDNAMRSFYSFMKLAEKSDLILMEALTRKNSSKSSLYILDFVKEEPCISESTSIVAVKKAVFNESENFESSLNPPEKGNEEPVDISSHRDRRLAGIGTAELTDSENDISTSPLKRILAKSEDEANSQRNSCEGIRNETIEEESEDFSQGDSFSCQPRINSTGSLPYVLDIVKEEPRVSESASIVAVKDAVINESEHTKSSLDHPKLSIEELYDISSCKDNRLASDTEPTHSDDVVPIDLLKKRSAKNGNDADSQRNSSKGKTRSKTMAKNGFKCEKCGKEFKFVYRLHVHMNSHADPLKSIKCNQCGKKLKHRHSLLRHMQLHTNPKQFKCEHCKKTFVKESSCRDHSCYKRVYKNKTREKFECEICGKKFSKDYLNNVHMKSHKGTKNKCNQCGKEFMHRDSLSRHMKWHDNPNACKCEVCDKALSTKESYASHMNRCHPEKLEKSKTHCAICVKSFSTKFYLDLHMVKHKGITRKCDKCGKDFMNKDSLRRHIKWHSNPTPFKCEKCGRLFDRRYRYNSHVKICEHAGKQQQLKTKQLLIRSKPKKVGALT